MADRERFSSPEEIATFIRGLASALGKVPTVAEAQDHGLPRRVWRRFFDAWSDALGAAGMTRRAGNKVRWTRARVIEALRAYHLSRGKAPELKDLGPASGLPSVFTVVSAFGSLREALAEAGLRADRGEDAAEALGRFLQAKAARFGGDPGFVLEAELRAWVNEFARRRGLPPEKARLLFRAGRKMLAEAGVRVVMGRAFSRFWVRAVFNWLRGRPANGVLLSRADLNEILGSRTMALFAAVAETGSVTEAGKRLGLTGTAVSAAISRAARRAVGRCLQRVLEPDGAGLVVARRGPDGATLLEAECCTQGRTPEELAVEAGVSRTFVTACMAGRPVPKRVAFELAAALALPADWLFADVAREAAAS